MKNNYLHNTKKKKKMGQSILLKKGSLKYTCVTHPKKMAVVINRHA